MNLNRLAANFVHGVIGTPTFLMIWVGGIALWMIGNRDGLFHFDPQPYFILNIIMSVWATLTLPLVTMCARWLSEQQDKQTQHQIKQLEYTAALLSTIEEMNRLMSEQITDTAADVDAIRDEMDIHRRLEALEKR